jgi:hypothetical protein
MSLEAGQGGQQVIDEAGDPDGRPGFEHAKVKLQAHHRPIGIEVGTSVQSGFEDAHLGRLGLGILVALAGADDDVLDHHRRRQPPTGSAAGVAALAVLFERAPGPSIGRRPDRKPHHRVLVHARLPEGSGNDAARSQVPGSGTRHRSGYRLLIGGRTGPFPVNRPWVREQPALTNA